MCLWLALVFLNDFVSKRVEPVKRYEHLAGGTAVEILDRFGLGDLEWV